MNEQSKEDLLKFKKEQLVEIIEMCHKANKYYLTKINEAIDYIEENCLEFNVKYACQGLNNDKVDILLEILRGKDNE